MKLGQTMAYSLEQFVADICDQQWKQGAAFEVEKQCFLQVNLRTPSSTGGVLSQVWIKTGSSRGAAGSGETLQMKFDGSRGQGFVVVQPREETGIACAGGIELGMVKGTFKKTRGQDELALTIAVAGADCPVVEQRGAHMPTTHQVLSEKPTEFAPVNKCRRCGEVPPDAQGRPVLGKIV